MPFAHLFHLPDGQDEAQAERALEVLERDETAQDGPGPQRVAAAGLDGLGLGGTAAEQVHQRRVELQLGGTGVDVVFVVLRRLRRQVVFAARTPVQLS